LQTDCSVDGRKLTVIDDRTTGGATMFGFDNAGTATPGF